MFQINFDGFFPKYLQELSKKVQESQAKLVNPPLAEAMKEIQRISNQAVEINIGGINRLKGFQELLETIAKETKELPEHVDKVHSYFAQKGWFVPFNDTSLKAFKVYSKLIDREEHDLIETKLQNYIRKQIPVINNNVEKYFPKRHRIIDAALEAHSKNNYILSIPTLLAQADGMFSDLLDKTFFTNNENELKNIDKRILKKLAQNGHPASTSSLGYLLVKQLQEKSIIHEDYHEFEDRDNINADNEPLNRNYILHGKALKYDNEPNSLRTISLVGLLCDCKETFTM